MLEKPAVSRWMNGGPQEKRWTGRERRSVEVRRARVYRLSSFQSEGSNDTETPAMVDQKRAHSLLTKQSPSVQVVGHVTNKRCKNYGQSLHSMASPFTQPAVSGFKRDIRSSTVRLSPSTNHISER
jgi:hypothetical protein